MSPRILLTRPQAQSEAMAALLETKNLPTFIEPMLEIAPIPGISSIVATALAKNPSAILTTSSHALTLFPSPLVGEGQGEGASFKRDPLSQPSPTGGEGFLPLWVVGETSAKRALEMGFAHVHAGGGSASGMAKKIAAAMTPTAGPLLYLRGADIAFDLTAALTARGFTVEEVIVYEARARESFSPALQERLRSHDLAAATFFSHRTLEIFSHLTGKHGLTGELRTLHAFCLSDAIADHARRLPWAGVHTAAAPTQSALIEAFAGWRDR